VRLVGLWRRATGETPAVLLGWGSGWARPASRASSNCHSEFLLNFKWVWRSLPGLLHTHASSGADQRPPTLSLWVKSFTALLAWFASPGAWRSAALFRPKPWRRWEQPPPGIGTPSAPPWPRSNDALSERAPFHLSPHYPLGLRPESPPLLQTHARLIGRLILPQ